MVDGIDANRNKWQDLCSSDQHTRRASLSDPGAELGQSPESDENTETNQHLKETLKQTQDGKCTPDVSCRVKRGVCDDQPAAAGDTTSTGEK